MGAPGLVSDSGPSGRAGVSQRCSQAAWRDQPTAARWLPVLSINHRNPIDEYLDAQPFEGFGACAG